MDLTRPQTPEAALITAIIMQAYRDLFVTVQPDTTKGFTTHAERDQAIAFLTDHTGAYARHRNYLCSLIGLDGNVLAERIRRMMEGADFPHAPKDTTPTARHEKAVESLRRRWQYLKNPRSQRTPPASPVGTATAG